MKRKRNKDTKEEKLGRAILIWLIFFFFGGVCVVGGVCCVSVGG